MTPEERAKKIDHYLKKFDKPCPRCGAPWREDRPCQYCDYPPEELRDEEDDASESDESDTDLESTPLADPRDDEDG